MPPSDWTKTLLRLPRATTTATATVTASATATTVAQTVANDFRAQWRNPSDIFSLLLLVGGDVIQKALAQFSMTRFRPIAFSFGWVAYAFSALYFAIGNLKNLPDPDCPCSLVNLRTGTIMKDQSWLLGRLIRHHGHWGKALAERGGDRDTSRDGPKRFQMEGGRIGLRVFVYDVVEVEKGWTLANDWPLICGLLVTLIQVGIAAVPAALYKEWEILVITVAGSVLAYATAQLEQYGTMARQLSRKALYALTGQMGEAIIIRDEGLGTNLQDLTAVAPPKESNKYISRIVIASVELVLWVALLITVSGLQTNTWYMVAVGSLGMLQNIVLAGAPRSAAAFGINLKLNFIAQEQRVMHTLIGLEDWEAKAGSSLLPVLFPAQLRPVEQELWEAYEQWATVRSDNLNYCFEERKENLERIKAKYFN